MPKEIKDNEYRVAMTPGGVKQLSEAGHRVLVESGVGDGSGFGDTEYHSAGGTIVPGTREAWSADLVIKVKEPQPSECVFFAKDCLFTYLHLAAEKSLTVEMINTGVAGRMAVQGGCVETIRPSTHSDPIYLVDGVCHYGVTNMPGAVPRTSAYALSNAVLPFLMKLATDGFPDAVRKNEALSKGFNIYN